MLHQGNASAEELQSYKSIGPAYLILPSEITRMGEVLTPRDRAYLDILHIGLVLSRNFARAGKTVVCPIEAEHLHGIPTLIGEENEHRHVYYLRGTRRLYLEQLRELGDASYLEEVCYCYSRPWRVLADAIGMDLPGWDQDIEPRAGGGAEHHGRPGVSTDGEGFERGDPGSGDVR